MRGDEEESISTEKAAFIFIKRVTAQTQSEHNPNENTHKERPQRTCPPGSRQGTSPDTIYNLGSRKRSKLSLVSEARILS